MIHNDGIKRQSLINQNNNFWNCLDELLSKSEIIIDLRKGSVHPQYPQIVYLLDYGHLADIRSSDNEGADVWIESDSEQRLDTIICIIYLVKQEMEIKLLVRCTSPENAYIKTFYNNWPQMGGIIIERPQ